jgi:predicted RNase H-like nuclease (RuvC/YqgF family)
MSNQNHIQENLDLIEKAEYNFRMLSDAFPSSEIIKKDAKSISNSYKKIISLKDSEISELKEKISDLMDKVNNLEKEIDDIDYDINGKKSKVSLEDEMKFEVFELAAKKYTLAQIEERLGNKFQLM